MYLCICKMYFLQEMTLRCILLLNYSVLEQTREGHNERLQFKRRWTSDTQICAIPGSVFCNASNMPVSGLFNPRIGCLCPLWPAGGGERSRPAEWPRVSRLHVEVRLGHAARLRRQSALLWWKGRKSLIYLVSGRGKWEGGGGGGGVEGTRPLQQEFRMGLIQNIVLLAFSKIVW